MTTAHGNCLPHSTTPITDKFKRLALRGLFFCAKNFRCVYYTARRRFDTMNAKIFEHVSLSDYMPFELNAAAYEFLSKLRQVVPFEIEVKIRVEGGEPAQEIVNAAQNFDLVVMGSRGFGGMDDSTGSVAKFVKENCSTPIIFVKGTPSD